ncbi:hypothetical protein M422DRAFT_170751, partial [Sphaerobolus stellatus SS14]
VPMDHINPSDDMVATAMIRVRAKVFPTIKDYRGPIYSSIQVFKVQLLYKNTY